MQPNLFPNFSIESEYSGPIVAIDEVGRGPWAGPVMTCAVFIPDRSKLPQGVRDSKQLSASKRDLLATQLQTSLLFHVGVASVEEIDSLNILEATKLAMRRAYDGLGVKADVALIDGNQPPALPCSTRCVVKGDSISLSIACASIIAKVTRDRYMAELAQDFPYYGWERNAGYGTKAHQAGIARHGITPHHRTSFAPIRAVLESRELVT